MEVQRKPKWWSKENQIVVQGKVKAVVKRNSKCFSKENENVCQEKM